MSVLLELPPIRVEDAASPSSSPSLGFGQAAESKVTIGRSDAMPVGPADVTEDEDLSRHLQSLEDRFAFVRLALRMNLRPAGRERITRALFSVMMTTPNAPPGHAPFTRALVPDRLSAGRFTTEEGISLGARASVPGAELTSEASNQARAELQLYYVVAYGLGESDAEWRYQTTKTMPALEGAYSMGLVAQVPLGATTEARLSLEATVRSRAVSTNVAWQPTDDIARVVLNG